MHSCGVIPDQPHSRADSAVHSSSLDGSVGRGVGLVVSLVVVVVVVVPSSG